MHGSREVSLYQFQIRQELVDKKILSKKMPGTPNTKQIRHSELKKIIKIMQVLIRNLLNILVFFFFTNQRRNIFPKSTSIGWNIQQICEFVT